MEITQPTAPAPTALVCDICGHEIVPGEAFTPDSAAGPAEHTACTADWFRRNFGREGLS